MAIQDDQFPFKRFQDGLDEIKRRLDVLERPTGTQTAGLLAQVQQAVANIGTAVTAFLTGGFTTNGNITAPNGTLVSTYARAHTVTSSYVAAYIDGSGPVLSTVSSKRFKRDIFTVTWTREQRDQIRTVFYRLRSAYILATMRGDDPATVERLVGVIGEELLAAGFDEFVVLDDKGRVFTVHYELLALIAIDGLQQAERRQDDTDEEVSVLRQEVADLRALLEQS